MLSCIYERRSRILTYVYWVEFSVGFAKLAVLFHRADCIANTLKKCIKMKSMQIIKVKTGIVKVTKGSSHR